MAEGTKQLEPLSAPDNSFCRITISIDEGGDRIPFALIDCSEEYRLNVRVNDFIHERIYFGFGNITDYGINPIILNDINFQIKDPQGNIVAGYELQPTPDNPGEPGFIETREEAHIGPDINNTNPEGYVPLVLEPTMNGDYVLEFAFRGTFSDIRRSFQYFDVTVADGEVPIPGRLWSKAWQLSSGSVTTFESATYSSFYIYSNDSIVTTFQSNGLAGGIWVIYSNEWGCSTTGTWSDRRKSVVGNATVPPQYKIFLNDPDPSAFPTGIIGEMISAEALPHVCDTVITFAATVTKGGNIEILIDVPPLNPGGFGPEDVQLGYSVLPGYNELLPAWDVKDAFGVTLSNGTEVEATINFLNGLTNIPLHDVEDNPNGFKVDILRPIPSSGDTKLKIFWDDTDLPVSNNSGSNIWEGCIYDNTEPVTGCHEWVFNLPSLGDMNTINSWWYYSSDDQLKIPITLELLPRKGNITGPFNICASQSATFRTTTIPLAPKYIWRLTGHGVSVEVEKNAPDTTFTYQFTEGMPHGQYSVSVYGLNPECGAGETAYFNTVLFDVEPPMVAGPVSTCLLTTSQYQIEGSYSDIQWSVNNGEVIGSSENNQVTIQWTTPGTDTIRVLSETEECGVRFSILPVLVNPLANANFITLGEPTSCPGLPLTFIDNSVLESGFIADRNWFWDDGFTDDASGSQITHSYSETGIYNVRLRVTTDKGCPSEVVKQIRIIPYPEASFTAYSNCVSQAIQLNDISVGIDLAFWEWDFGNAPVTADNLNHRQPYAVFHEAGQYPVSLVVTNKYGCKDTVIQQLSIHYPPTAAFTHELPCQGSPVVFTDNSIPADAALVDFLWNTESALSDVQVYQGNPASIVFDEATNYVVKLNAIDAFGCIGRTSSLIAVIPKPVGAFDYLRYESDLQGFLRFDNHTTGAIGYLWDFGNNHSSTLFEPVTQYELEGNYTIVLVSESPEGCTDTVSNQYYFSPDLYMPNAFTPDNDGLNDVFKPLSRRTTLEPYLFQIFNRWGQLIFSSSDPEEGWDGTFEGRMCSVGVYSYLLHYREGIEGSTNSIVRKGTFTLLY